VRQAVPELDMSREGFQLDHESAVVAHHHHEFVLGAKLLFWKCVRQRKYGVFGKKSFCYFTIKNY
jgi:hypothetical protein